MSPILLAQSHPPRVEFQLYKFMSSNLGSTKSQCPRNSGSNWTKALRSLRLVYLYVCKTKEEDFYIHMTKAGLTIRCSFYDRGGLDTVLLEVEQTLVAGARMRRGSALSPKMDHTQRDAHVDEGVTSFKALLSALCNVIGE